MDLSKSLNSAKSTKTSRNPSRKQPTCLPIPRSTVVSPLPWPTSIASNTTGSHLAAPSQTTWYKKAASKQSRSKTTGLFSSKSAPPRLERRHPWTCQTTTTLSTTLATKTSSKLISPRKLLVDKCYIRSHPQLKPWLTSRRWVKWALIKVADSSNVIDVAN